MTFYVKHIRNPKTLNIKYWYLKRRYLSDWLYNIPIPISLEMYLATDDQRRIELFLKFEAIEDLFNYILAADRSRRFIFQLLENNNNRNVFGNDRYYFGIVYRRNTWWLIKLGSNGSNVIRRLLKKRKLTYLKIYNLVNFTYDLDVIGFRLLELFRI
jgi:hypothetical protein